MIAENSRIAHAFVADSKATKQKQIGKALQHHGKATRQELALMTGIAINVICPRVVELAERGLIEHIGNVGSPPRGVLALTEKGRAWLGGGK
ncbi:hypothetical protein MHM84_03570 [Halomonas sp. McH1-25]|uniref:hypothetical protein n=1 Tax=unclassified Halomonas TaxID=2609666 RepID=UPI001EF69DA7|nr:MULTISPECIES: hypothetical protein [unclassified Halomonas]MCG7598851.1 hypothetical protein [Halomonas sp. McH1-25]MCP1340814.1 hypothetical protein [Halomonas sp. FL8]MCP1361303.1 hypothetical protein [Halomonas sp. BBD45]MCP1364334.1 hypothetical protein [Halomonas sp. BBD48]